MRINNLLEFGNYLFRLDSNFVSTLKTFGLENSFHVRRCCHWVGKEPSSAWWCRRGVLTSAWMGSLKRHASELCRLGTFLDIPPKYVILQGLLMESFC
ncbi:hypothetical protein CEXT_381331 [Caerostris extrusa]|uniref:Uncharacterized protein n=1 Tax=Caerostris extrusa TaxID=172846 RepID=A0AAV4UQL1_CAEEX|nr:hypothetical protein CEXT_381331 [Caerostris extrusa]